MMSDATRQRLQALLAEAGETARCRLAANIAVATDTARTLRAGSGRDAFLALLDALAGLLPAPPPALAMRTGDHAYESLFKLCRSVQFSWGPWIEDPAQRDAAGAGPHSWGLNEILSITAPGQPFRLVEIGCGTGAFGYDIACRRPEATVIQTDISLESLVFAVLLQTGTRLTLPRRVDFERAEDGIGWFVVVAPPPARPIAQTLASLPQQGDADFVAAINAFSLFDDPAAALADAARQLCPGGHLLWIDLLCWRTETPPPRRIAGPAAMAAMLVSAGLEVRRQVSGIPYLENWGFERCYDWRSHLVLAQRPADG